MNKLKKNNVVKFPSSLSEGEREIEAIVFAAAEPLDVETIELKVSKKVNVSKLESYECGVSVKSSARKNFSVKFYLIAILFILFDVEIIYLYPWAVVYNDLQIYKFYALARRRISS